MINKTKYKLLSSSAYNERSPVKSVSAVVPYKCLPAGADFWLEFLAGIKQINQLEWSTHALLPCDNK